MKYTKIIKEYGIGAGGITFLKDECLMSGLRRNDSIEVIYLKIVGQESPILLNHNYIRKVIKRGIYSVFFVFPQEVMEVFGLKVGDIIEIECNIIKCEPQ